MKYDIDIACLRQDERTAILLKSMFRRYGYCEYKLTGFEDYSLYAENKSFLDGSGVLSFSVGGRLLALRPDVTLSVIKNAAVGGGTEKLFYDERVYRKAAGGGEFSELRQIGTEVIGEIDGITETEVCELALKTLEAVDCGEYILDISHSGIIEKALNKTALTGGDRLNALAYLASKNAHDFSQSANACGVEKRAAAAFAALINLPSDPARAIEKLGEVNDVVDISAEIAELKNIVDSCGKHININLSVCGDFDYYNGIVFKGYVQSVPYAVLSGGRYDRLMGKFGKSADAIGFALYLGELCEYYAYAKNSIDVTVVYDNKSAAEAYRKAESLRAQTKNVLLSREARADCGEIIDMRGGQK